MARVLLALLLILATAEIGAWSRGHQDPGQVRSGVTVVPIDVRVVDRDGRPITDLTRSDFTVFEDDVPHVLTHFSLQNFRSATGSEHATAPPAIQAVSPIQRRFLIVLGGGRLEGVGKGVTGLIRFLKSGLLPTDLVAILAYKRVTDFTQDTQSLIRFLELRKSANPAIDGPFAPGTNFDDIDRMIDSALSAPGLPKMRELPYGLHGEVGELYRGIEHLRALDGEKHLIFVTERGITFGRRITATLAEMAADARVTLSPMVTNGTPLTSFNPGFGARRGPAQLQGRTSRGAFSYSDLRKIADETGGVSSAYERVDVALDRLNNATRVQYLLGYQPSNMNWDGRHRRIEVRVTRSGASVAHRRSYYAGPTVSQQDRDRIMIESRMASAAERLNGIGGIRLRVSVPSLSAARRDNETAGEIDVQVTVDVSTLRFDTAGNMHTTTLELAVFCGDERENVVGEMWRQLKLAVSDETLRTMNGEGYLTVVRVPVTVTPRHVKAVVYERSSDSLGSAVFTLK
jgi:VWFA-related protein